ncbi:uncharacterized protein F4812DRAFT_268902 [Daldinia caldariorum]|uniref:uncharacterized protein n=1 Tax=Daldinia caldariorum TaxID=326644 RepID=UPI002008CEE2|nr:uncharacterized protein F4812DRAFT_268902 [Daldinia caldariorum]KAI1470528.1 hypothetical protein F4812DRAFT_268902 [Daldinia caldariorum]
MAAAVATTQVPLALHGLTKEPPQIPRRRDVLTNINYYKDPGDGSLPMPIVIADNTVKNERPHIPQQTIIHDVTGEEDQYTLDNHGFQFLRHESATKTLQDFQDEEHVKAEYYPESIRLLKEVTGASRIFLFDHKTRCGPSHWHKLGKGNRSSRGPLFRAHVDQSYAGAEFVLRRWFPDEADELLKRRYQIINIWRPIRPVLKDPFGVADGSSIPDADLVGASIIYPADRDRDETWTILPPRRAGTGTGMGMPAHHRWYYKHAQRPDEVLLVKCFDSDERVPARRAPHSAFEDREYEDREARESIEARALVFYD